MAYIYPNLAAFPRSPRRALRRDDRLLRPVVWIPTGTSLDGEWLGYHWYILDYTGMILWIYHESQPKAWA